MIFLKKFSRRQEETAFLLAETGGKWYTRRKPEDGGKKMDRIPKPGEFYRHFKNKMYQIVAVAVHSETGERLVIYQALYGDYGIYARPLDNFLSPVDREKYPNTEQEFRFERTEPGCTEIKSVQEKAVKETTVQEKMPEEGGQEKVLNQNPQKEHAGEQMDAQSRRNCGLAGRGVVSAEKDGGWGFSPIEPVPDQPNPLLIEFLDAENTEEQLAVLRRMEGCVGKRELDSICVYLDISTRYGSLEEQTEGIRRYLKLQMHYDASRLRRDKRDDSSCFI